MHAAAEGLLSNLCDPPEHLISLQPTGLARLLVIIVLFGKEIIPCEVGVSGIQAPEVCWIMDPKARSVRELSHGELIQEVGRRLDRAPGDAGRRGAQPWLQGKE